MPSEKTDKIRELEIISRKLEPNRETREKIFQLSSTYIHHFIQTLSESLTYITADYPNLKALEITNEGISFETLLEVFTTDVNHAGINSASGGHLGYIPGGGLWLSSIGDMLAAATNKNSSVFFSGQGAVVLENKLVSWLAGLMGFPSSAYGYLSSGGSMANLSAITAARDAHQIHSKNVAKSVIYFTDQVHHCIHKAIHINGLDETVQRLIPVNGKFQMDADALEKIIQSDLKDGLVPFLVIASAGTTNSGAIDPLDQIADVCQKHKIWFHIDAAYGGFFMLVEEMKEKLKGIERCDSLVLDPHKGLFLPFGTGVVLVRDGRQLIDSHSFHATYLMDNEDLSEISPSSASPELTRHFRGLRMWLPLHFHGLNPFAACLREKIYLCQYFHEEIKKLGFETGNEPELTVSLFRYPANDVMAFNKRLVEALHQDGRIFFSATMIGDQFWIRCAVLHFRTHLQEIELGLRMIAENLQKIKEL